METTIVVFAVVVLVLAALCHQHDSATVAIAAAVTLPKFAA